MSLGVLLPQWKKQQFTNISIKIKIIQIKIKQIKIKPERLNNALGQRFS